MEYIEGQTARDTWPSMAEEDRNRIITELASFMAQMRSLEGTYIGSIGNMPCNDPRLPVRERGPFASEDEFNDCRILRGTGVAPTAYRQFLRNLMPGGHRITFAHGDIRPENVMVRDGHIVALLDWEMAGWYPEYWDAAKCTYNLSWKDDWSVRVQALTSGFEHECAAEQVAMLVRM